MNAPKTLEQWKKAIAKEVPFVGLKPFSHNIISLGLTAVAEKYGNGSANQIIEELGLGSLGWKKVV
jgi:hypothetical protein